jgi:hypothetical protein
MIISKAVFRELLGGSERARAPHFVERQSGVLAAAPGNDDLRRAVMSAKTYHELGTGPDGDPNP